MRFIHTSEIHWGLTPESDRPWGKERANDIKESFRKIVKMSKDYRADCLFIAGGLFHRQPTLRELRSMDELFSTIPKTKVVIVSGELDRMERNAALHSFRWGKNVTWLTNERRKVYFSDIQTEVYGISLDRKESLEINDEISGAAEAEDEQSRISILLIHTATPEKLAQSADHLVSLPYDYIAIGGRHRALELVERKAAFAGSPEPISFSEPGQHGVYFGDIDADTRAMTEFRFMPVSDLSYIPLQVGVTADTDSTELLKLVTREIRKRGGKNVYRVRLTGRRNPDVHFDLGLLLQAFRVTEIYDETEPAYDYQELYRQHSSDMIGFFIQAMLRENEDDMSYIERMALNYGIDALMETAE